jgi:putative permease
MLTSVGDEMNQQLGNYVRGKFIEILIVGGATFVSFIVLGLNYAALLGVLVGLSVLIPYVGAAVVTLPVFIVAVIQFGWTWDLGLLMIVYGVIQFLDGNVLVPLLFSEVVDLHPITIIVAILAFGGLWGIWGVFFAIPLATLIKAIYKAWPRRGSEQAATQENV